MQDIIAQRVAALLGRRRAQGSLRTLNSGEGLVDFSSNDYLGLAAAAELREAADGLAAQWPFLGATGSRLLTGHNRLMEELEAELMRFHEAESALIFNSGYDANIGWLPALVRKGDIILYDAAIHASLHDAMRMAQVQGEAFAHNDIADLRARLPQAEAGRAVFVLVESVYSMDGDLCPLVELVELCERQNIFLFVDEAHGTGVFGERGQGLVQALGLAGRVALRLHTFGKALGGHGAALLCGAELREYFINYARSLIYTTALPPHSLLSALAAYRLLDSDWGGEALAKLRQNIAYFAQVAPTGVTPQPSAIQFVPVASNAQARDLAGRLRAAGLDVRPILAPTVPEGQQRLRVCLHSFNTFDEINVLFAALV